MEEKKWNRINEAETRNNHKGVEFMRTVAVVPMKLNNTRLPQKNTKSFTNGKPLCTYILNTLKKVDGIDDIFVYCSNPIIQDYIPHGISFLQRSAELDLNTTSMTDVLYSFAREVEADIYVMTHTTAPFVSSKNIQKGLEKVISREYDSSFSAKKNTRFSLE